MLDHEHLVVQTKCLEMLYQTLHIFPTHFKIEIIRMLLDDYFYKLIFSWSWNVRTMIIHVLLYQLQFIHVELVSHLKHRNASQPE